MRERAQGYLDDRLWCATSSRMVATCARKQATETMRDVREAMGLLYS
jgi:hypothetical protein